MTDLASALEQAVGMPNGIDPTDVRSRVRRRRPRRFALRAALGVLIVATITPAIVASMSGGTRREDVDFGADPTATAPSTSTSAMLPATTTPDGIALTWRTGTFATDLYEGPVAAARTEASWSVVSTGKELSPFLVSVRTGPTAARLAMSFADGDVDMRRDPEDLEVFAALSPTDMIRLDPYDADGNLVATCVPVQGASGCR